jgi:hypothetical protein
MANNNPYGFDPIKYLDGADWNSKLVSCYLPSTDANDMFIGDPVDLTGTSNTSDIRGFKPGTLPAIVKATAGSTNKIYGFIVGFKKPNSIEDTMSYLYRKASSDAIAFVALANNLICSVQIDADLEAGDIGSTANFLAGSGGSTITSVSSAVLESASIGTEADKQFRILALQNEVGNELGNYAKVEVVCNLPRVWPYNLGV